MILLDYSANSYTVHTNTIYLIYAGLLTFARTNFWATMKRIIHTIVR